MVGARTDPLFGLGTRLPASVPVVGTVLTGLVIVPLQTLTLVVGWRGR